MLDVTSLGVMPVHMIESRTKLRHRYCRSVYPFSLTVGRRHDKVAKVQILDKAEYIGDGELLRYCIYSVITPTLFLKRLGLVE